jgi:hypothetical protein
MKVKDIFEAFIPRDGAIDERDADHEVRIVVHALGSIGGTPSVSLSERGVQVGFDWDHGKLLLYPEVPLTRLTSEDVAAIHESVKKGQSWHAYQAHKNTKEKHSEQLQQCKEEITMLKAENAELRRDAERYRYLRDGACTVALSRRELIVIEDIDAIPGDFENGGEMLNAALDQLIAKEQKQP